MRSHRGRLVSFQTVEDFEIIGMIFQQDESYSGTNINETAKQVNSNRTIIIHVHGNYGNFYQNKFLWYMSEIYQKEGIDFLTVNLSAHDGLAEGYYGKQLKYVGGGIANYNDSQKDIEATIKFALSLGYKNIILQGHSLGCDKVIDFVLHCNEKYPLILLSPVDSYAVQSAWIFPETVNDQVIRLKKENENHISHINQVWGSGELDWLTHEEYGAKGDTLEWTYEIPITREALISILEGSAFQYLNAKFGKQFKVDNPTFVYIGKRDGLQMHPQSDWDSFLRRAFLNYTSVLELDADHDIIGVEAELTERIVQWIKKKL